MSTGAYSENCYEDAVIETLKKAGWEYLHGPVANSGPKRLLPRTFCESGVPLTGGNGARCEWRG